MNPLPPQSEWRQLSEAFPQIERSEGSRAAALKALALRMDASRAMWQQPALRARAKDSEAKIGEAKGVFWTNLKIAPENNSASGSASYRLAGRRNSQSGEIVIDGIFLLGSEVDRLWPPGMKKPNVSKLAPVSEKELLDYVNEHGDGKKTERILLASAKERFHPKPIPIGSRWKPAFAAADPNKKRQPGKPRKYDKSKGDQGN